MSNTSAAMKAAKEVQADVLAPVIYRQANDWWTKAKEEYKFKNFDLAEEYAQKARKLAEEAEYEVLKNPGATRAEAPTPTEAPAPTSSPYAYPTPTAIPVEEAQPPQGGASGKEEAAPAASPQP